MMTRRSPTANIPAHPAFSRALASALLLLSLLLPVRGLAAEASALDLAVKSISADRMQQTVNFLADDTLEGRAAGSRGGRAAGAFLELQFEKLHLQPAGEGGVYFQEFGAGSRNIIGTIEGSDPALKQQYIVVSAHYDHVGYGTARNSYGPIGYIHHGADDNASGVAGLLAVVEALNHLPQHPRRSILLALWDGEEAGLLGSRYWIKHPTVPLDQVPIAVNLDMIGRLRGGRVEIYGARTAYGWRRLISEETDGLDLSVLFHWDLKPDSDHYSFIEHGIPAVLLFTGLHADYHRPSDTADKINSAGMREMAQLALRMAVTLANADELPKFRPGYEHENAASKATAEKPAPTAPGRLGVSWADADNEHADPDGLRLLAVDASSPAEKAGLKPGDRIVRFAGHKIDSAAALRATVAIAENPVAIVVRRSGSDKPLELNAQLSGDRVRVGITWVLDDAEPHSVIVIGVVPDSPADRAGIKVNERIYQIGGKDFSLSDQFERLLLSAANPVVLTVENAGQIRTVRIDRAGDQALNPEPHIK